MTNQSTELEKQIKRMLDNTILDWNRASQLTTIGAKSNYEVLTPAIQTLVQATVLEVIGEDEQEAGYNGEAGESWDDYDAQVRNSFRKQQRSHLKRLIGK